VKSVHRGIEAEKHRCVQPVNERLRLLGGTAKVALDLLEYHPNLERAFLTVCGSAMLLHAQTLNAQYSNPLLPCPSLLQRIQ